jgi:hypothetical protein
MIITLLHARRDIEGILDRLADMPMNEMPPWDQ